MAPALSDAALTRRQSYSRRPLWLALGIVAAVFLAAALHGTLQRGTWMDEFWTLWFSQHDIALAELVRTRWVADYNPPLFSFWHWLFTPLFGSVPLPHRLMNVLALAWAAYFLIGAARRSPASANVLIVHALLVLSLPAVVPYFAELRSYFSQIWIFYVLLGTLIVANDRASDLDWQQHRWLAVMLSLSVLMALNIHYVSTTLAGPLIGAAVVLFWWRGQRRLALTLVAASALGAVPLFSFYFMHSDYLSDEMQTFWIRGGVVEGLRTLLRSVKEAVLANLPAAVIGATAVLAWMVQRARASSGASPAPAGSSRWTAILTPSAPRRGLMVMLVLALLVFGGAMLVLQARHPLLIARYLFSLQVIVAGLLALMVADAVAGRRVLLALSALAALISIGVAHGRETPKQHWDATARMVAERVRACPSSTVYVAPAPRKSPGPQGLHDVLIWAHRLEARLHGFEVAPLDLATGRLPAAPGTCPALLWLEHVKGLERLTSVQALLEHLRLDIAPADPARAQLLIGESGLVLVVPAKT